MAPSLVTSVTPASLRQPFLGEPIELCIVTPDLKHTLTGLVSLGIGPFKIFRFCPETVTDMTFRVEPAEYEIQVAFAQQTKADGSNGMIWEVMCPIRGPSVLQEFLDCTGGQGGIQHVCFDFGDGREAIMESGGEAEARAEAAKRRDKFLERGIEVRQGGVWKGKRGCVEFMYFETTELITTCFESYVFSADWEEPDDYELFPPR